ncbi:MAG: hypothetical protein DMG57_28045 [Acidobacteria bacterium]|nr:MAG: hypothetical protein DMG57_28045 [Acidobacteriota bacterium]
MAGPAVAVHAVHLAQRQIAGHCGFLTAHGIKQPMSRFTAPLRKQLAWYAEWRWYGFGEPFYPYEAFRGHMLMTGLRVLR